MKRAELRLLLLDRLCARAILLTDRLERAVEAVSEDAIQRALAAIPEGRVDAILARPAVFLFPYRWRLLRSRGFSRRRTVRAIVKMRR